MVNKILKIQSLESPISTKKNFLTYELNNDILDKNKLYNFSIQWKFYLKNKEIKDMKYFATGVNEDIFIINSNLLKPGKENKITLNLNITEKNNSEKSYFLNDTIKIAIQSIDQQRPISIKSNEIINLVMYNNFYLNLNN